MSTPKFKAKPKPVGKTPQKRQDKTARKIYTKVEKALKTFRRIGFEAIYPLQELVAGQVLKLLLDNEKSGALNRRSPVVILQPQAGKTGVIIATISAFIANCIARGRTFQIVVLCGLAQNALREQTEDRLWQGKDDDQNDVGAKLGLEAMNSSLHRYPGRFGSKGVLIFHNSPTLRDLDLNTKVDVRLWIGDEVHLGNVKDGNIDLCLQHHGVRICEQIHTWDNTKTMNHFVGVSATPSAHLIKSDNVDLSGEALFHCIYEPMPATYNSLAHMFGNGRLKETESLFIDKVSNTPSAFFQGVLTAFHKSCEENGPGLLVIRAVGEKNEQLISYVNSNGCKIECHIFDSKKGNIAGLNKFLSTKPSEPIIVIIRGSMRAGITLGRVHYILGWVETKSSTSDAPTQSGPGRACGHGRTKDTYPIYCDVKNVLEWIKMYDDLDKKRCLTRVPKGVQSKALKDRRVYGVKEITGDFDAAWKKYVEPNTTRNKDKKTRTFKNRTQFNTTSSNVYLDIAGMFLEGVRDSNSSKGILVDGPTSKKAVLKYLRTHDGSGGARRTYHAPEEVWGWFRRNHASYKRLLKEHPDARGNVFVFDEGTLKTVPGQGRDELQKTKSAVRSN